MKLNAEPTRRAIRESAKIRQDWSYHVATVVNTLYHSSRKPSGWRRLAITDKNITHVFRKVKLKKKSWIEMEIQIQIKI